MLETFAFGGTLRQTEDTLSLTDNNHILYNRKELKKQVQIGG